MRYPNITVEDVRRANNRLMGIEPALVLSEDDKKFMAKFKAYLPVIEDSPKMREIFKRVMSKDVKTEV